MAATIHRCLIFIPEGWAPQRCPNCSPQVAQNMRDALARLRLRSAEFPHELDAQRQSPAREKTPRARQLRIVHMQGPVGVSTPFCPSCEGGSGCAPPLHLVIQTC